MLGALEDLETMNKKTDVRPAIREDDYDVVVVDASGQTVQLQRHHCRTYIEDLGAGTVLEMVEVPPGTFMMGNAAFQGYDDERPRHWVRISSFLLGKYPVTQEQWHAVMGQDRPYRSRGHRRPADRVSWQDANDFCAKLSRKRRKRYRLPTEAEWEYACRAGTATPFSCGETLTTELANYVGAWAYQQEPEGIYRHETTEVGSFPPNAFGLHDMHGNVWEWCEDEWHGDYSGAPTDGTAWTIGSSPGYRVLRGGSWHEPPANCRSATRLKMHSSEADDCFGFRVAIQGFDENLRPSTRRSARWLDSLFSSLRGKGQ